MFDLEPWMMAAMEEEGLMDTETGLLNRVAKKIAEYPQDVVGKEELFEACYACNVDSHSLTQDDIDYMNRKLAKM